MDNFKQFSKNTSLWEWWTQVVWGSLNFCPTLSQFQVRDVTRLELSAIFHKGACQDFEKPKLDMAFLLIVPGKPIKGDMAYALATVWVHIHTKHASPPWMRQ